MTHLFLWSLYKNMNDRPSWKLLRVFSCYCFYCPESKHGDLAFRFSRSSSSISAKCGHNLQAWMLKKYGMVTQKILIFCFYKKHLKIDLRDFLESNPYQVNTRAKNNNYKWTLMFLSYSTDAFLVCVNNLHTWNFLTNHLF